MSDAAARAALRIERPQYLTFGIADDEYAIGILRVREILQYPKVARVPQTPPWIRGVMNLRGTVVPVIDLGAKFGLGESRVTRTTCVIVLEVELAGELANMAIMTDKVNKVVELAESEIEAPPAFGTRVRPDCLLGIATVGDHLACLLDVDRVLTLDESLGARALSAEESRAEAIPSGTPGPPPGPQDETSTTPPATASVTPLRSAGGRRRAGKARGRARPEP